MLMLGLVAVATLAANGAQHLRYMALAFLGVAIAAHLMAGPDISVWQAALSLAAALVTTAILFIAARDGRFGEDPGWRLWVATIVAATTTAAAFAFLRTASGEDVHVSVLGADPSGVTQQAAAFWLLSSGVAILLTARGAVRGSLGALLMLTGTQLLVQLVPGPQFALYGALILALLIPVGSFTFQVHRNRSYEAAFRHFSFVLLGGCLGLSALALSGSLPRDQPPATFVLLVAIIVVAFALKLAAIPFHPHAALLAMEVPASALALYFGVLVPTTFIAFAEILTLSGLLPAIVQISKVQDLLLALGTASALVGAFLATGSIELRRVTAYSVIANLGQALVGIATLSGPGIVGAIAIVLVTGAGATQQLLAAGAIERRSGADQPSATA